MISSSGVKLSVGLSAVRPIRSTRDPACVPWLPGRSASSDRLKCIGRETNRMRKLGVQQQKLGDALRPQIGGVDFAVGFETRCKLRSSPIHSMCSTRSGSAGWRKNSAKCRSTSARDGLHALHEAAHLDELPAFAVSHGGIGDALKQMRALRDGQQEIVRLRSHTSGGSCASTS